MLGQSSNLRPNLGAQSPPTRPSEEPFPTAGSCHMYRPAPLRGRSPFDGKKVLLIDGRQATREVRENVLRSHGIEVDAAETLQSARVLWKPHRYHLVLLDVRRQFPGRRSSSMNRSGTQVRGSASPFSSGHQSTCRAAGPSNSHSRTPREANGVRQ